MTHLFLFLFLGMRGLPTALGAILIPAAWFCWRFKQFINFKTSGCSAENK